MNPTAPDPTPAPLHDIVGPVWFWPYPLWITVAAGIVLLGLLVLLGMLAKKLFASRKRSPTSREKALAALEVMRPGISTAEPYAFGVGVSEALRLYLSAEYGFRATTQTSLEFLNAIRSKPVFSENEKQGLSEVLERTDLLKFARTGANESELLDLLDIAARLVRGEPQSKKEGGGA
jgi:hypothetical protein